LTGAIGITYFLISMSPNLKVELGARSYDIMIGRGILAELGERCRTLGLGTHCLVVSDSNVDLLYGDAAADSLRKVHITAQRAVVPAGEESKSNEQLFALYGHAVKAGLDRQSFILALGGGVVGDLAGYLAASFLRGIRFVQVPTTLLAMVDSSVGGKTGINLPQGKNLVGAFYQPAFVCVDIETLKTLPAREYISGLAEVVKYGMIWDQDFFGRLEADADGLKGREESLLASIISRCCQIKAEVVSRDERENGVRAILNFGHTLGHAIELVAGYGEYLHGEAIAIGMVYAARLSVYSSGFPEADYNRLVALLKALGLPYTVPENMDWSEVRRAMSVDKKVQGRTPRFVLVEKIGTVEHGCELPDELLAKTWMECRDVS